MKRIFPLFEALKGYNKSLFTGDLSAGLTVGVMLIPQGMAYSLLAGLPPIYGLYASTIPLILYALFGTSRQLAVGPVAMVALLIASGVGALTEIGSDNFIGMAILLSLMVGVLQLSMGLFRLGFLVNFLSHPVVAGFTSAAALIIGFSQLKHLLGVDIARGKVHETIIAVFDKIQDVNLTTLVIGLLAVVMIILFKRINKRIPAPMIVVILSIIAVYFFSLDQNGVKIVGEVPAGLPAFSLPSFELSTISELLPLALTISLIGFMESIAVAKAIQKKHRDYEVVPNQELKALGIANIGGSLFQAFPTTGGFSRTAVNDQAGAKTGISSIISAAVVILTLIFFTDYFYYLPKSVLAAIIMVAVFGLIDFKEAKFLWGSDKRDFTMFMVTAVATLALGVEEGILVGVVLSLVMVIYQVSYPHVAELGKVKGTSQYRNVSRHEGLLTNKKLIIVRLDAPMYFSNLNFFNRRLKEMEKGKEGLHTIILNAKAMSDLDSSGIHNLSDLKDSYSQRGVRLAFAGVRGPVRDKMKRSGLVDKIGPNNFFMSVEDAVLSFKGEEVELNNDVVFQANTD